jgi:hypothetical protein
LKPWNPSKHHFCATGFYAWHHQLLLFFPTSKSHPLFPSQPAAFTIFTLLLLVGNKEKPLEPWRSNLATFRNGLSILVINWLYIIYIFLI